MMIPSPNSNITHPSRRYPSGYATVLSNPAQGWLPEPRSMMNSGVIALPDSSQASLACKTSAITSGGRSTISIAQPSNTHRPHKPKYRA